MSFSVGDRVACIADASRAESLSPGHGGWVGGMRAALGKVGTVESVDSDGDIKVRCEGTSYTWHPACWTRAQAIGVGSRVTLAPGFETMEDAAGGPLKSTLEVGVVFAELTLSN